MSKITCEKILLSWLKEYEGKEIAHYLIDEKLPRYGREIFGAHYSSSTYHRVFCWLKNDEGKLRENGLVLDQTVEGAGKVNRWRICELAVI